MGAPVPLKNASDSYVSEKYPSKNYNSVTKLFLADGSAADTRYAYIYFGLPSGLVGTTLLPSKLRLYSGAGFAGSVTITIQRLTQKFSANRVNWNNKPTATATGQVQVAKTGAAAGTMWEFDITALLQTVANGAPWYGFRISATGSAAKWLYSAQGLDQYRPTMEVVWSDSPDTPEALIPDNGQAVSVAKPTLQWDFVDPSGDQTLQSAQIRMFSTQALADANTNPDVHDTGVVPLSVPEYDLDTVGSRSQASVTTTSASTAIGGPAGAFTAKDVGETITGTGIPAGTTIVSQTGNAAVLSAAATATGTITATIGVSYPGLAADGTVWWRVLNTDGAGLPSGWSDPASFTRKTKGTLTITNPAAGGTPFVNDTTPPFSWTFTGRTQVKYEVILTTPETPADEIWTSGIITSTDLAVTPPDGKITVLGKTYRLIVRIYDDQNRITVPDDPIYVEAVRDFVYQQSGGTAVTGLGVTLDNVMGKATLEWTSATAPDEFVIYRDSKEIATLQPVDLLVSGTTYRYVDDEAPPRVQHTWSVARKVNGVTSTGNPSVNGTTKVLAPVLSKVGGTNPVLLLNPDVAAERVESSDVHYILGDAPPILITQSIRGYEGTVTGVLASDSGSGLTADQQLANLETFKTNPGQVLKLIWINKVMKVVVRNITDEPLVYADGKIDYLVSFEFFEVGF